MRKTFLFPPLIAILLGIALGLTVNFLLPGISFWAYKSVILETAKNSPLTPIKYKADEIKAPWSRELVKGKQNAFYIEGIIVQRKKNLNKWDYSLIKENPLAYTVKEGTIKYVIERGGMTYYLNTLLGIPYTYEVVDDVERGGEYIETSFRVVNTQQFSYWFKRILMDLGEGSGALGVFYYKIHLSPEMVREEKNDGGLIMSRHL
ncbi:MAG: hypothetical protein WCJ51_00585 [Candidatus Moraniibacteriota bacterium]